MAMMRNIEKMITEALNDPEEVRSFGPKSDSDSWVRFLAVVLVTFLVHSLKFTGVLQE